MPLILGKDIEIENPFPGVRIVPGVDGRYGSQAVTVSKEVLHPGGDIRHICIWVMNL